MIKKGGKTSKKYEIKEENRKNKDMQLTFAMMLSIKKGHSTNILFRVKHQLKTDNYAQL